MIYDKTIMTVFLEWDYADKSRGESGSKIWFYSNLKKLTTSVVPFWFDEYFTSNFDDLQLKIIDEANRINPDLIFFMLNKHQITKETLQYLKDKFITVGWFGDDQWRYDDYSKIYAPFLTHVVTTDMMIAEKYKKNMNDVILSEWAAEPRADVDVESLDVGLYKYDVSFVGGENPARRWFVDQLKQRGVNVICFGAGWSNGRVSYTEMDEIFRKSKVNLNISNSSSNDTLFVFSNVRNFVFWLRSKKTNEQVKARNFEIPMAGGFQITNYVSGLERSWHIGKDIAVYDSIDDCANKIKYFLNNDLERLKIKKSGYQKASSAHTYKNRIENILKVIFHE